MHKKRIKLILLGYIVLGIHCTVVKRVYNHHL